MLNASSLPFFQSKTTTISILSEINCIFCVTKGFQPSPVYREQADKQIEAFAKFNAHGIIWDLREAEVITQEDQDWTINDWQPRAVQAGYRRGAIVIPQNIFGHLSVKRVISQVQSSDKYVDVSVQYFTDTPSAYEWMKSELLVLA